jgi:hypothetical protein
MLKPNGKANFCLSDYIAPQDSGVNDYIGLFAVTTGIITANISFFFFKAIVTSLINSHRESFTARNHPVKDAYEEEGEWVVAASDLFKRHH